MTGWSTSWTTYDYDYTPERDLAELLPGALKAKGLVKAIGKSPTE